MKNMDLDNENEIKVPNQEKTAGFILYVHCVDREKLLTNAGMFVVYIYKHVFRIFNAIQGWRFHQPYYSRPANYTY